MTALQRQEEKLRILEAKASRLAAIPEADRTDEHMDALLEAMEQIDKLERVLTKLRQKKAMSDAEEEDLAKLAQGMAAEFVSSNDIYFIATLGVWYWYQYGEFHSAKTPHFMEHFRAYLSQEGAYKLFQATMDAQGRKLNAACYAWDDRPGYLNLLQIGAFCPMDETAERYHPIFDLLLRSLGGDKAENVEHLQQLILAKWQHPRNFLLPCVVFADGGGTGKSLLIAVWLTALFGAGNIADNLSIEMAFGKFNRPIAGKVIVFVNEAPEDNGDDKGLLRVIHSPTVNIEAKGRDPILAVNTALYFISTNPKHGGYAIKLAYNDVDRRFSIMHGGKPLKQYVTEFYDLSPDDDFIAAHSKLRHELEHVLRDPAEIGKWLGCMQRKHGDVRDLKALHGQDYKKQAKDTIELHIRVFDAIFLADDFQYIRSEVLFQLYKDNGGSYKNIGFHRLANVYLEDRLGLDIHYEVGHPWEQGNEASNWRPPNARTKARVYVKHPEDYYEKNGSRKRLRCNDAAYGSLDNGRWTWHVDVI